MTFCGKTYAIIIKSSTLRAQRVWARIFFKQNKKEHIQKRKVSIDLGGLGTFSRVLKCLVDCHDVAVVRLAISILAKLVDIMQSRRPRPFTTVIF